MSISLNLPYFFHQVGRIMMGDNIKQIIAVIRLTEKFLFCQAPFPEFPYPKAV